MSEASVTAFRHPLSNFLKCHFIAEYWNEAGMEKRHAFKIPVVIKSLYVFTACYVLQVKTDGVRECSFV